MLNNHTYNVDIVYCIDVTASMGPHIDRVKQSVKTLHPEIVIALKNSGMATINNFRIRVIAFRDYAADSEPMVCSQFFTLPKEELAFKVFVDNLQASGGGDLPENGLEALALAMQSEWFLGQDKARQIIVMFTDTDTHPLGKMSNYPLYPPNIPKNLTELCDFWELKMDKYFKRLLIFAPAVDPWQEIEKWDIVIHHPAQAGEGLKEVDHETIIHALANSISGQ